MKQYRRSSFGYQPRPPNDEQVEWVMKSFLNDLGYSIQDHLDEAIAFYNEEGRRDIRGSLGAAIMTSLPVMHVESRGKMIGASVSAVDDSNVNKKAGTSESPESPLGMTKRPKKEGEEGKPEGLEGVMKRRKKEDEMEEED